VVWRINGPSRIKNVDNSSGKELLELVEKKKGDFNPIVIDLKDIVTITDGALSNFFEFIINNKKEIYFINNSAVRQTIRNLYDEYNGDKKIQLTDKEGVIIFHEDKISMDYSNDGLRSIINKFIDEEINNIVKGAFVENEGLKFAPLMSTPILATGRFDASIITSNADNFTWVCVRMNDMVEELINEKNLLNAQLLSVSLRASPFANSISLLQDIPMRTIDHLGPFQKKWNFNSLNEYTQPEVNYIFIGDFIVGGTELKLANLYSKYCSSNLEHAVVIGRVLEKDRYSGFNVNAITSLHEVNSKCKYKLFE